MCRRITCPNCGKPSFAGCGLHIESVLGDVAPADRCRCAETAAKTPAALRPPPAEALPGSASSGKPGKP